MTLKIGKSHTLRGTINPSDVFDSKLTWTTSNTKIATVDKNGKVILMVKISMYGSKTVYFNIVK